MFKDLFQLIIAPLIVGIVLALFDQWLNDRHDRK
ncbi:type I toxin-antitoxin system Fst family toxin [Lactobacillus kalixensis]|nr:type I toxin-antitoxin system Fst family toxin [Lactobacillus kalixensis]